MQPNSAHCPEQRAELGFQMCDCWPLRSYTYIVITQVVSSEATTNRSGTMEMRDCWVSLTFSSCWCSCLLWEYCEEVGANGYWTQYIHRKHDASCSSVSAEVKIFRVQPLRPSTGRYGSCSDVFICHRARVKNWCITISVSRKSPSDKEADHRSRSPSSMRKHFFIDF